MRQQLVNILLALVVTAANAYVRPEVLTVEMMETPLGLEEKMPRFSWKLSTDEKDVMQKSYRILVSSSAEKLAADNGDVWDSGTVKSRQSLLVPFDALLVESADSVRKRLNRVEYSFILANRYL